MEEAFSFPPNPRADDAQQSSDCPSMAQTNVHIVAKAANKNHLNISETEPVTPHIQHTNNAQQIVHVHTEGAALAEIVRLRIQMEELKNMLSLLSQDIGRHQSILQVPNPPRRKKT